MNFLYRKGNSFRLAARHGKSQAAASPAVRAAGITISISPASAGVLTVIEALARIMREGWRV